MVVSFVFLTGIGGGGELDEHSLGSTSEDLRSYSSTTCKWILYNVLKTSVYRNCTYVFVVFMLFVY